MIAKVNSKKSVDSLSPIQNMIVKEIVDRFIENGGKAGVTDSDLLHSLNNSDRRKKSFYKNFEIAHSLKEVRNNTSLIIHHEGDLRPLDKFRTLNVNLTPTPEAIDYFYPGRSNDLFWFIPNNTTPLPLNLKEIFIKLAHTLTLIDVTNIKKAELSSKCGVTCIIIEKVLPIFESLKLINIFTSNKSKTIYNKTLTLTDLGKKVAEDETKMDLSFASFNSTRELTSKYEAILFASKLRGGCSLSLLREIGVDRAGSSTIAKLKKLGFIENSGKVITGEYEVTRKGLDYLEKYRDSIEFNYEFILQNIKLNALHPVLTNLPSIVLEELKQTPNKPRSIRDLCSNFAFEERDGIKIAKYLKDKKMIFVGKNKGKIYLCLPEYIKRSKAPIESSNKQQKY